MTFLQNILFFLTNTYATLWGSSEGQLEWRDGIFQSALKYHALLDGILLIFAMRKFVTTGNVECKAIALRKQTVALEGFTQLLSSLDSEN